MHTARVSHRASPSFQPATFVERGASVPFTTPTLAGTRVRPADRAGLELIVPNPSGGRGDYILPPTGLRSLCRPTVHDALLMDRIVALPCVDPSSIRHAARRLAMEGLAGRAAAAAAEAAQAAEAEQQLHTNFHLLLCLVQQAEQPGQAGPPPEAESPADLELRAKRTVWAIAPRLRQGTGTVAASLEQLAALFAPVGLGPRSTLARIPRGLAALDLFRREVAELPAEGDEHLAGLARNVVNAAVATLRCAQASLHETRRLADRLPRLLVAWHADPAGISRQMARPDWLLDGWERPCRLWQLATTPAAQRAALLEIVPLLPVIPGEAGDWAGLPLEHHPAPQNQRLVVRHEDWRTGLFVQDTIARNEALLAA